MTPEASEHLDRAREYLSKARNLLDVPHYNDDAGRAAYLAGLHAAQALISEQTGKLARTHEGVNREFNRLTRDDLRVDTELRRFLPQAYDLRGGSGLRSRPRRSNSIGKGRNGNRDRGPVCRRGRRSSGVVTIRRT